jgi:hypothetical protein
MLLCGVKAGCARTVRNLYWILGRKIGNFYMTLPRKHKLPIFLIEMQKRSRRYNNTPRNNYMSYPLSLLGNTFMM